MYNITIKNVFWDRIWLFIDIETKLQPPFYLVHDSGLYSVQLRMVQQDGNRYKLKVNITNPGNCRFIYDGTYHIQTQIETVENQTVIDRSLVNETKNFSRSFTYAKNRVVNVIFNIEESETELPAAIRFMNAKQGGNGIPRTKTFSEKMESKYNVAVKKYMRLFYKFCKVFSVKKKKKLVLFYSEQSEQISTNLRALRDEMIKENLDVTIAERYRSLLTEHYSIWNWLGTIALLAKVDYLIVDDHCKTMDWLELKDTVTLQLWHAGAGFKSTGYSRFGMVGSPGIKSAHRQYTYGIAGSKSIRHFFSEVWGINETMVLPTGMPRLDEFLNEQHRTEITNQLLEKYPLLKKKVILFAPTYRGTNKGDATYPYELIDMDKLYEACGDEYSVIFKMHPFVSQPIKIPKKYADKFIDLVGYPNINDLFYLTDLLITDYSSNIYEFSLMRKPMLFFAYDKDQYSFARGFHRNYEENVPGKICYTFDEVIKAIEKEDFEFEKVQKYVETNFDHIDTNASKRVIDWVIRGNIPEELLKEIEEEKKYVISRVE